MQYDRCRVIENVREATTEDLLDRVTCYRDGMEPEAIDIIEAELYRRGYGHLEQEMHQAMRGVVLTGPDGLPRKCEACPRPASAETRGWHHLTVMVWGQRRRFLPLFPRRFFWCAEHTPVEKAPEAT